MHIGVFMQLVIRCVFEITDMGDVVMHYSFRFSHMLCTLEVESPGPESYLAGGNPTARLDMYTHACSFLVGKEKHIHI